VNNIFTPKGFLTIGGTILVLVGVLGFFLIGPTEEQSIFGAAWWFDTAENWAHLVLGIVALAAAYGLKDPGIQKNLVMVVGVVALLVGIYGFFSGSLLGANLQDPLDNILHLAIGAWGIAASMKMKMMG
jgi:hypothetical protein